MKTIFQYFTVFFVTIFIVPSVFANCASDNNSINISEFEQVDSNENGMELFDAIDKNDKARVIALLQSKVDLEVKNNKGQTPLMYAAYVDNNELAFLLIEAGADVNAQDQIFNSPFLYAGAEGNLELVKKAIANGADFTVFNRYGGTALIPAAERGHLETVKYLVKVPGFPINHVNRLGWTALMEVVLIGKGNLNTQTEIVRELINAKADVNIPDSDGVTALSHAIRLNKNEIVKLLKQAGAKEK